jgi:uncharacterized protein (TIGR04255 family)
MGGPATKQPEAVIASHERLVWQTMEHAPGRLLKNAPITEALIDIRASPAGILAPEALGRLREVFGEAFPQVEDQRQGEFFIQLVEGRATQPTVSDLGITGLLFRSEERNEAVQVQQDGAFVFSKLRPYSSWEDVSGAARRFWLTYSSVVPVSQINRMAVRYINQFVIPAQRSVAAYLTAPPAIPDGIDTSPIKQSLSRLVLVGPAKIVSRVTQATEAVESGTSVLIDIDCFREVQFAPTEESFWSSLEELRRMKNRIFFGSITPFAVEEFDK